MNLKKNVILKFLTLLIFISIILIVCGGENNMSPQKSMNNFSKIIEKGDFDDLSLRIYYISTYIFTRMPLSIDDLLRMDDLQEIVVNGDDLKKHMDLLQQINDNILTPFENETYLDARIYYVFETKKEGIIFSVTMRGGDDYIFVNERAFKFNEIFYNIIIPFLPENMVEELKPYLNK